MSEVLQELTDNATLKMISLQVQGITCLLEQHHVIAMQEFSGNHEAKTVCIETSLGLSVPKARNVQTRSILQLKIPYGCYHLEVNQPVLLNDVPYADIQPLPSLITTSIYFPYIRAIAIMDKTLGLILDINQLN